MLRWGIVGAGHIARVFCNALQFSKNGHLQAIASETPDKARQLASIFQCDRFYDNYLQLMSDDTVDAVYIATIHPAHTNPVLAAISASKHVLVEKPIATNVADATTMIEAARSSDIFLMEGYMYRCHPQMALVRQLIGDGLIGDVRLVRSEFGYATPYAPETRHFNKNLGGGSILDVGCYPISFCRFIAGAADKKLFADPIEFKGTGVIGESGVDHYASAVMKFGNGVVGEVAAAITCDIPSSAVVHGSKGILRVQNPWLPSSPCRHAVEMLDGSTTFPDSSIIVETPTGDSKEYKVSADRDLYSYEADVVSQNIVNQQASEMSWDDTLGNMRTLEYWLTEVGYEAKRKDAS